MPQVLFGIPLIQWVLRTIEKMNRNRMQDIQSWSSYWYETYRELGGLSYESGNKPCPMHAAYGLWRLGRIKETNIPFRLLSLSHIDRDYGKNASYAVLALELLESKHAEETGADLWRQVQTLYQARTHQKPAISQQGAVTVARILFEEHQIAQGQE